LLIREKYAKEDWFMYHMGQVYDMNNEELADKLRKTNENTKLAALEKQKNRRCL